MVTGAATLVRTRRRPTGLPADGRSARVPGGFEILRADQVLAPLILGIGLVILLVGMVDVVLVFLIRRTLHAGDGWYGTAGAAWTAGMVAGALGASSITTERVQTWATIAGAGLACVALAPWSQQSGCSCRFQSSAGSGTDTQAHASRPCSSAHTRLRAGTRLSRCQRRRSAGSRFFAADRRAARRRATPSHDLRHCGTAWRDRHGSDRGVPRRPDDPSRPTHPRSRRRIPQLLTRTVPVTG